MQSLVSLFQVFPFPLFSSIPEISVTGLAFDSRKVQPGNLFVVLSGPPTDGHRYIPDAIARGAAAVVGCDPLDGLPVPYIRVENSRQVLAHLAAAWFGRPAQHLTTIGVTGTDGKTTTTNLIYQILKAAGIRAGLISTVSAVIGDAELDTGFHVTTPDAPDVQRYLAKMVETGLTHAVLETTSHGLAQFRVDACNFAAAAVTNITHEHLNFHGTYAAYQAAKARLFEMLIPGGRAILNRDDASFDFLHAILPNPQTSLSYGFDPSADLRPTDIRRAPDGTRFTAAAGDRVIPIETTLVGDFNISNILAALGVTVFALGVDPSSAQRGVAALHGIPGRMERIDLGQSFTAIVDFAHTPNALRRALETVRAFSPRSNFAKLGETEGGPRIIAVFGSAGARDQEKRRLMAEVSLELADRTILTAEDPRTEELDDILKDMAEAARARGGVEGMNFWRVPHRGDALRLAVALARPGDVVIACGKGHEQSMCFGEIEYPWDDRTALKAALSENLGISGPAMPALPTGG